MAMLPKVGALAGVDPVAMLPNVGALAADPNCPNAPPELAEEEVIRVFPKAGGEPNG